MSASPVQLSLTGGNQEGRMQQFVSFAQITVPSAMVPFLTITTMPLRM